MAVSFDNLQNTQRIRYEAFANFATEINNCNTYNTIAVALSGQVKFILDSFIFRICYQFDNSTLTFEVFRGNCTFLEGTVDSVLQFEKQVLSRGIPVSVTRAEIKENPTLNQTVYHHPKVHSLSVLPTVNSQHQIIVTNALRQEDLSLESDFKFLRLISDLIASKLSQLFLIRQIEQKRLELEQKNKQITILNQTLEEKVSQRTVELQEANLELQTLFYRTSHDFRAPLANIVGLANLAEMVTDDPDVLNLFDKCKTVVGGLDKMLFKLNTMSSFEFEKNFEKIDFKDIVQKIKQKFQNEIQSNDIVVRFSDATLNSFSCHKAMLLCIFENLFENAICFCSAQPEIDIHIENSGPGLLIRFADNGTGIPPEIKDKIFAMYYRGNERSTGTGLGLYIVKKLVKMLNGKITVESKAGVFTAFNIGLPA
ncbi:sensor histidine kinase [Mucilaginibacter arboris]|uniref:histidine kinase n=1 Tax=Mucilaginibacter arboris TaxID=2682090 RepID=A0A7K1SUL8_9SPHI|nr:HAMP domain-containing sensor histidine kinase [Mucilaginibacter arboris]MVN20963.1 GHKL domain-containing protein [Mucilaginibacter arboris]